MAKLRRSENGHSEEAPAKYRFPSQEFFRRKFELYGQESLDRPDPQESLQQNGLLIVEGFWDVLRQLGIMSNHITDEQLARVVAMAQTKTADRVGILFDTDEKGAEGAKEVLWKLSVAGMPTRLLWSRQMCGALFNGKEPESISQDDLTEIGMYLG